MSQVIKKDFKVISTRDSAVKTAKEILETCQTESDIINVFAVLIRTDGNYQIRNSANIGRHRKIGILAEMMHNLIVQE